jgi:hypothetical protein
VLNYCCCCHFDLLLLLLQHQYLHHDCNRSSLAEFPAAGLPAVLRRRTSRISSRGAGAAAALCSDAARAVNVLLPGCGLAGVRHTRGVGNAELSHSASQPGCCCLPESTLFKTTASSAAAAAAAADALPHAGDYISQRFNLRGIVSGIKSHTIKPQVDLRVTWGRCSWRAAPGTGACTRRACAASARDRLCGKTAQRLRFREPHSHEHQCTNRLIALHQRQR